MLAFSPALPCLADYDDTPVVIIRSDDCRGSWRTPFVGLGGSSGLQYGKLKQIPITWAVVTALASNPAGGFLKWSELVDYMNTAGGELASHSVHHVDEPTQTDFINEIIQSKAEVESHVPGYVCTTFIQPGTWTGQAYLDLWQELNQPIAQAIQATYAQSRAFIGGGAWVVGDTVYRYGLVYNWQIDGTSPTTDAIRATLDVVAGAPGSVFTFMFHGIEEQGSSGGDTRADVLKALFDRLAELRDQSKIRLLTINDYYTTTSFSPSINHLADGGLEVVSPGSLNPVGPVNMVRGAVVLPSGGIGNSRCAQLPKNAAVQWSAFVPPGRYKLTWWQEPDAGQPNKPVRLQVNASGKSAASAVAYTNSGSNWQDWQQKTALVLSEYAYPSWQVQLYTASSDATALLDNVSLVLSPVSEADSPTGSVFTPRPGMCLVSWRSPNDPTVTSIVIRYNSGTHPLTPTSGTSLLNVPAVPGQQQSASAPITWPPSGYLYFSVFGVRADQTYTEPDIAIVTVDNSKPYSPQITTADYLPDGKWHFCWSSSDPQSGIYGYRYGVGWNKYNPDIVGWTNTTDTCAEISSLPGGRLYLFAQAQNNFGSWSSTTVDSFGGLGSILDNPDGTLVSARGKVTAVFDGFCYIEDPDRVGGVRLIGNIGNLHEGDTATVEGTLSTQDGERMVAVN